MKLRFQKGLILSRDTQYPIKYEVECDSYELNEYGTLLLDDGRFFYEVSNLEEINETKTDSPALS